MPIGYWGLWGSTVFRPILARFDGDATGGMMASLRTGTLGKTVDLVRYKLVAASVGRSTTGNVGKRLTWRVFTMAHGAWTLGEWPLPLVRLSCAKCGRSGQYRTTTLIERYGRDMNMPELQHVLAQCSRP